MNITAVWPGLAPAAFCANGGRSCPESRVVTNVELLLATRERRSSTVYTGIESDHWHGVCGFLCGFSSSRWS